MQIEAVNVSALVPIPRVRINVLNDTVVALPVVLLFEEGVPRGSSGRLQIEQE